MIVYREVATTEETGIKLSRLDRLVELGDPLALFVELGELEQGVADALNPQADGWDFVQAQMRIAASTAASALLAARAGQPCRALMRRALELLGTIPPHAWPRQIRVRPPEGYVHYALDPLGYADAARAYLEAIGPDQAARAVVIGVRSIGTSLSALVAAVLQSRRSATLRPRGGSGDRHLKVQPSLARQLQRWWQAGGDVLVVDEGPGATGETLEAVAQGLHALDLPADRLVLIPSREGGMEIAPETRRRWFATTRKYLPPFVVTRDRLADAMAGYGYFDLSDITGGRWREIVPEAAELPTWGIHERCKLLARDARGWRYLLRYAGPGRWAEMALDRATRLATAGVGPDPAPCGQGFIALHWIDGRPARPEELKTEGFLNALALYLSARARLFGTGRTVDPSPLAAMLLENAGEVLGPSAPGLAAAVRHLEALPRREAFIPDARLDRHEWVRTAEGFVKVDALDHGDGLRLPGPCDLAWDLAGAALEYGLAEASMEPLIWRVAAAAGQSSRALQEAVQAYRAPYAAFKLGEMTLAARETPYEVERARFEGLAHRYERLLKATLRRCEGRDPGRARLAL